MNFQILLNISILVSLIDLINSVELTFELPDNDKQCYYQEIEKNKTAILEYQVSEKFVDLKIAKMMMSNFCALIIIPFVGNYWWPV